MAMTQCERVIDHMMNVGPLTSKEANDRYGISRLASRINDLKKQGYAFSTERIHVRNRYGEDCTVTRYSLEEQ